MKTHIDLGEGVSLTLTLDDADRSWREAAAATKRRDGCGECGHHRNAHRTGNCASLVIPADKSWNIANARKCGCSHLKRKAA